MRVVLTALYSNPGLSTTLDAICQVSVTSTDAMAVDTPSLRESRNRHTRLRPDQVDELVQLYQAGQSVRQLADHFSVNRTTVLGHLERRAITRRPATRKLTDTQVRRAAKYHQAGESLTKIAARFNVDRVTITKELRRAGQLDNHA